DMLTVVRKHLRPHRHLDDEVLAAGAGLVLPGPALAALGPEMLGVAEVDQGIEALDRFEDDVAAFAAVAAIGAAIFDIFLAPEADGARAAGTGAEEDLGLVEEMHGGDVGEGRALRYPGGTRVAIIWRVAAARAASRGRPSAP